LDFSRGHHSKADVGIFSEYEWFSLSIKNEGKTAVLLNDLSRNKFNRLVKTIRACRFRASALELLDRIGLGFAFAAAARVPAFQFVIGENFYVIPPGLPVEVRSGLGRRGNGDQQRE
jgi:hypothetical protein